MSLSRIVFVAVAVLGVVIPTYSAPCQNIPPGYVVAATSHQNVGGIEPTNLVVVGTRVRLFGLAEKEIIKPNCTMEIDPLAFSWTLTFQGPGTLPVKATLFNGDTLQPEFNADAVGTFVAELDAPPLSVKTKVEVIDAGGWFSIGPYGENQGNPNTGRINTLAFDPKDGTLYAGSALGGVFISTDFANSWAAMTDQKGLATLGIGALAVGSDGAVYAGTGDLHHNDDGLFQSGSGIWKSTDKGLSWSPAGIIVAGNCPIGSVAFTGNASKIVAHPTKAGVVYVASDQGLLRTVDGGNCWSVISKAMPSDLAIDSSTPTTLYVGVPGQDNNVLKTTNAEDPNPAFAPQALPVNDNYGWVLLAAAPSSPSTVYAALGLGPRVDFVRTTNGGASWIQGKSQDACDGQLQECAYAMALAVSPTDADRVVYGQVYPTQSTDGTQSWIDLRSDGGHKDYHAMVFAPSHPDWLYGGNDGGVYSIVLPPKENPLPLFGWAPHNYGLNIAQPVGLAIAPTDSTVSSIGVWDNGSQTRLQGRIWNEFGGGDGFYAAIDAFPNITYYYTGDAGTGGDLDRYDGQTKVVLGTSNGFSSSPYKVGELESSSANDRPGAKFYIAENANTTGKLDWRCADPDPDPANKGGAWGFEFGPGGWYYATHTDGSIWQFRLDPNLAVVNCGANQTNAQSITKIFQAPKPGPIWISLDPVGVQSLYAVVGSSKDGGRVVHLTQFQGNWSFTPLAGIPGDAGALPDVLIYSQPIQADPAAPETLYLGTNHGLWQGTQQKDGSYKWTKNSEIPDSWLMSITPHRSPKGYTKVLRLDIYGRGVWERYPPQPTPGASFQVPSCFNCEPYEPYNPEPAAEAPFSDRAAWFSVPYSYAGSRGMTASIQVVPTINGVAQPFFVSKPQRVDPGVGTVQVEVLYVKSEAPMGLHTNGLRVTVSPLGSFSQSRSKQERAPSSAGAPATQKKGRRTSSATLPFEKWWIRPEGRLLRVDAQVIDPSVKSVPMSIKVRINERVVEGRTPLTLPVPRNARVTVGGVTAIRVDGRLAHLQTWTENGALAGADRQLAFRMRGNTDVVAHFRKQEVQRKRGGPPLPSRD